jgi:hypothetical protein
MYSSTKRRSGHDTVVIGRLNEAVGRLQRIVKVFEVPSRIRKNEVVVGRV